MAEFFDVTSRPFRPLRTDVASGATATALLEKGVTVQLVRVEPGGGFSTHADSYGHLFHFLSGEGEVAAGGRFEPVRPGLVVRIPPGEPHSYRNTGTGELTLLSINVPA
jgi:mannose-6-phosphate isomerase-like protein (cupin superfamily)